MSELRLWTVYVEHPITHERLKCLGQGHSVTEALSDAAKTLQIQFRPKSDGKTREEPRFNILTANGPASKTMKEFEG